MPNIHMHDHRLWQSVRSSDLAVEVPKSNLVSHARLFLPSIAQLWNFPPVQIPSIRSSLASGLLCVFILCCTCSSFQYFFDGASHFSDQYQTNILTAMKFVWGMNLNIKRARRSACTCYAAQGFIFRNSRGASNCSPDRFKESCKESFSYEHHWIVTI